MRKDGNQEVDNVRTQKLGRTKPMRNELRDTYYLVPDKESTLYVHLDQSRFYPDDEMDLNQLTDKQKAVLKQVRA